MSVDADIAAPPIDSVIGFDPRARKRTLTVVALGQRAEVFVADALGGRPRPSGRRELGRIGELTVAVAVYAFDADADARTVRDHLARARAWVIAAGEPKRDRIWTAHLDALNRWVDAQRPDVVIGLCGDPPPMSTWQAYGGRTPQVADASAAKVLAGLVRACLRGAAS